jgi:hypothetical protein
MQVHEVSFTGYRYLSESILDSGGLLLCLHQYLCECEHGHARISGNVLEQQKKENFIKNLLILSDKDTKGKND